MKSLQSLFDSIDYNIKRLNNDVQGQLSVLKLSIDISWVPSWKIANRRFKSFKPKIRFRIRVSHLAIEWQIEPLYNDQTGHSNVGPPLQSV